MSANAEQRRFLASIEERRRELACFDRIKSHPVQVLELTDEGHTFVAECCGVTLRGDARTGLVSWSDGWHFVHLMPLHRVHGPYSDTGYYVPVELIRAAHADALEQVAA